MVRLRRRGAGKIERSKRPEMHPILRHLSYATAAVPALFLVAAYFAVTYWVLDSVLPAAYLAEEWPEPPDGMRDLMEAAFVAFVVQWPLYFGWALVSRRLTRRLRLFWTLALVLLHVFAIPFFLCAMWRHQERGFALRFIPHPKLRHYFGKGILGAQRTVSPVANGQGLRPEYRRVRFRCEREETPPRFFVVTAHNPEGKPAESSANEKAEERLRKLVDRLGLKSFPVTGGSVDFSHSEPGLGIVAPRELALSLARHFRQEALFEVRDGRVLLVSTHPQAEPDEDIGPWAVLGAPLPERNARPPAIPIDDLLEPAPAAIL